MKFVHHKGITAPRGFTAQGVKSGIKKSVGYDLAVLFSDSGCSAAGVFTTNKVQAACVQYNREVIKSGAARAIVVNSGNANACTGETGRNDNYAMACKTAQALDLEPEEVLVASTGVIGVNMPMEVALSGIEAACASLNKEGGFNLAQAIMTTDTMPKQAAVELEFDGKKAYIGAAAKGSGMIHPNMATMLGFITTDAAISPQCLRQALKESVAISYNMISVDGDTSTNDMVLILANGQAGNREINDVNSQEYAQFKQALDELNIYLAKLIARDGEGATHLIEVQVVGGINDIEARKVARAIVSSNLFKAAVYGLDANWGRIICAAGYSGGDFDPDKVDIKLGSQLVAVRGAAVPFDEEVAKKDLQEEVVVVKLDLHQGLGTAVAWGCDLTYDYVKINASYRS